jgi:hypothetical protein
LSANPISFVFRCLVVRAFTRQKSLPEQSESDLETGHAY